MSFETASVTSCGQSLLARATATNKLVFVNARIETTTRTASAIGSATSLPTLTNPVTGSINSVTYSLNQTRVTVRFNNLATTANFHTVWLMAKLANEADSAAVPICAIVSSEPVYIPTTSQSDTHIDIHMNLSFVRANGTVSITEGPAWMISDHEQYRAEVRAEFDDVEADIADLQDTYVTKGTTQTITGQKTFSNAVQMDSTLKVTGTTMLGTTATGMLTAGQLTSYAHTPIANLSYNLGSTSYRWDYVYGRYGNFSGSVSTAGTLSVTGASTLTGNTTVGGTLGVTGATTLAGLTSEAISSYAHSPRTASTSSSTGYDLGASDNRWKYVYARYGNFNSSISTAGTLSVTGASTLTGNTTVGGTLGVTGATTLGTTTTGNLTAGTISSYAHTPRTASTSSSTGYDLGASNDRWKYVYARYGNFSYSVTVTDGISVGGNITRPSGSTATQDIGTSALPFANIYATSFHGSLDGNASSADYADWAEGADYCDGNAATATKLYTARTLDGMSFNGTASITHYGTCSTTAATVGKTVSLSGFNLVTGARIAVKFTYSNTAATPTLNVNSTGAKAICYRGASTVSNSSNYYRWQDGDIVEFIYDGTNWVMVGWQTYSYYAYSATLASSATSATYATNLRYSSTDVLSAYSTSIITSAATIRPSTDVGASLGSSSYKWNYIYASYLGSSSYSLTGAYITSAYCTNLYSSGTSAVKCLSLGTNTSYANDLEIPGSNADGSRGYLHPSNDYGADLGETNHCFNKLYVKDIKAYGTIEGALSGTASNATKASNDGSGNTITTTYIKTISATTGTASSYTVYNTAASGYTSSSLSLYNSYITSTKGNGTTTSTTSLGGVIAAALTATGSVGMLRFVAFKTTGAWAKKSDGIYISGSLLHPLDMKTDASDSNCMIRLNATTTLNNSVYSGTWKILHAIGAITSGDMFVALAVRVA